MTRSPRHLTLHLLSLLFAAAPFILGLIRLLGTRSDFRLLWMALASCVGAMAVTAIGKAGGRTPGVLALSAATLGGAMLLAGVTAMLLGATSGPGIWGMGFVLGSCWAAWCALDMGSRPPRSRAT